MSALQVLGASLASLLALAACAPAEPRPEPPRPTSPAPSPSATPAAPATSPAPSPTAAPGGAATSPVPSPTAAPGGAATSPVPSPTAAPGGAAASPSPAVVPAGAEPLVEQARLDAARRAGVPPDQVVVTSVRAVEWRNTALGCPQPGMMYAQVIVPGYLVVLSAGGRSYEYHTDRSRQVVTCANPERPLGG